ncbi:MAG: hypothetical protein F4Z04_17250 [Acidobacteria bacterium]|nr:hypothetical protein [Acidobacteriota bacterium]
MTRLLSAAALVSIIVGVIWFLPSAVTVVLAGVFLLLAFVEYARLARSAGVVFNAVPSGAATVATAASVGLAPGALPLVAMTGGLVIALTALAEKRRDGALAAVGAAGFALLYLGLPLGALVAVFLESGRETLLLLLATIAASDTAQYYGGRTMGRRPLAPVVSPKKTVEGALCGVVAGAGAFAVVGAWWMPALPPAQRVAFGATLALVGIAGDLFESHLKRASGLKDASGLIPGHGGVLDRIDAMLFAAPVYYGLVMGAG